MHPTLFGRSKMTVLIFVLSMRKKFWVWQKNTWFFKGTCTEKNFQVNLKDENEQYYGSFWKHTYCGISIVLEPADQVTSTRWMYKIEDKEAEWERGAFRVKTCMIYTDIWYYGLGSKGTCKLWSGHLPVRVNTKTIF